MVHSAIAHLKEAEIPSKPPPSKRWYQGFLAANPTLFRTIKTKPIARARVTAYDLQTVEEWFVEYKSWCTEYEIEPHQVYNFDKTGFRIGVASGEEVVVPYYIKEVCILN